MEEGAFCELVEGKYYISIDKSSLPDGYFFTKQNIENNERDSKIAILM